MSSEKIFFNSLAKQGISETLYKAFTISQDNACFICNKTQARRLTPFLSNGKDIKGLACTQCSVLLKVPKERLQKVIEAQA